MKPPMKFFSKLKIIHVRHEEKMKKEFLLERKRGLDFTSTLYRKSGGFFSNCEKIA